MSSDDRDRPDGRAEIRLARESRASSWTSQGRSLLAAHLQKVRESQTVQILQFPSDSLHPNSWIETREIQIIAIFEPYRKSGWQIWNAFPLPFLIGITPSRVHRLFRRNSVAIATLQIHEYCLGNEPPLDQALKIRIMRIGNNTRQQACSGGKASRQSPSV